MVAAVTTLVAEARVRSVERTREVMTHAMALSVALSTCLAVIVLVAAPLLATQVGAERTSATSIRLCAIAIPPIVTANVIVAGLAGFEAFRESALARLTSGVAVLPLYVVAALVAGPDGVLVAVAVVNGLQAIVGWSFLRSHLGGGLTASLNRSDAMALMNVAMPAAMSSLLVGPVNWLCLALLSRQASGLEQVAVVNIAQQWRLLLMFVPLSLNQVLLPAFVRSRVAVHGRQPALVGRTLVANAVMSAACALPVALVARHILAAYSSAYESFAGAFAAILISSVLVVAAHTMGQVMLAHARAWAGLFLNAVWATILLGACVVLTPRFGAAGFAGATLVAYSIHVLVQGAYVARCIRVEGRRQRHAA
jgi:O-antigen/teichoic acid export membrane protein